MVTMLLNNELTQQAIANATTNPITPQPATANTGNMIIQFLVELNKLLDNPFVRAKLGNQLGNNPVTNTVNPTTQPVTANQNFAVMLLNQLRTPEGKLQVKNGLTDLIKYVGDVKLSELITILDSVDVSKLLGVSNAVKPTG